MPGSGAGIGQLPIRGDYEKAKYMKEQDSYTNPELDKLFQRYEDAPGSHIFAPLADACRKAGRVDEAVEICRNGLELHPDYTSGHVVLGKCLYDLGQMEHACDSFRRVLRMDAENLVALKYLGMILAAQGEMNEARMHFNRILALDPDNREIVEKLGVIEEPEEILDLTPVEVEHFEGEEITLGDESPETPDELATVTLADIFAAQGYRDKAQKIYREVLERDPGNEAVKEKLDSLCEPRATSGPQPENWRLPLMQEPPFDDGAETWDGGIQADDNGFSGGADGGREDRPSDSDRPHRSSASGHTRNRARTASKARESGEDEIEIADEKSLEQFKRWLKNADK